MWSDRRHRDHIDTGKRAEEERKVHEAYCRGAMDAAGNIIGGYHASLGDNRLVAPLLGGKTPTWFPAAEFETIADDASKQKHPNKKHREPRPLFPFGPVPPFPQAAPSHPPSPQAAPSHPPSPQAAPSHPPSPQPPPPKKETRRESGVEETGRRFMDNWTYWMMGYHSAAGEKKKRDDDKKNKEGDDDKKKNKEGDDDKKKNKEGGDAVYPVLKMYRGTPLDPNTWRRP